MKKIFFRVFIIILCIGVLCVAAVAIPNIAMLAGSADDKPVFSDSDENSYDCILVLGAGLRPDGTPSDMLADRLETAIKLYGEGYSDTILLSGDRSGDDYDEVSAMKAYCLERGVAEADIRCDNLGFSTYESIYNAAKTNEYESIIVVTQGYHLHRALYIADKMGFDAHGADAEIRRYRGQIVRDIREVLARAKDFYKVIFYE